MRAYTDATLAFSEVTVGAVGGFDVRLASRFVKLSKPIEKPLRMSSIMLEFFARA